MHRVTSSPNVLFTASLGANEGMDTNKEWICCSRLMICRAVAETGEEHGLCCFTIVPVMDVVHVMIGSNEVKGRRKRKISNELRNKDLLLYV